MTDIPALPLIDKGAGHAEAFRDAMLKGNDRPFHGEWVPPFAQGIQRLRENEIWAIFATPSLPDNRGLDPIKKFRHAAPAVPILVRRGVEDEDL